MSAVMPPNTANCRTATRRLASAPGLPDCVAIATAKKRTAVCIMWWRPVLEALKPPVGSMPKHINAALSMKGTNAASKTLVTDSSAMDKLHGMLPSPREVRSAEQLCGISRM